MNFFGSNYSNDDIPYSSNDNMGRVFPAQARKSEISKRGNETVDYPLSVLLYILRLFIQIDNFLLYCYTLCSSSSSSIMIAHEFSFHNSFTTRSKGSNRTRMWRHSTSGATAFLSRNFGSLFELICKRSSCRVIKKSIIFYIYCVIWVLSIRVVHLFCCFCLCWFSVFIGCRRDEVWWSDDSNWWCFE